MKKEHIKAIEQLPLQPWSKAWEMRNLFLFSYYCRGINFKDMAFLTWENIREGRLIYIRRKTGDLLNMELLPPALAILADYRTIAIGEHIFPILSDFHKTPQQIENQLKKVLKQMNDEMTELGKQIGLDFRITSYFARHTYATVMKRNKVSISMISEAMGHSNEKVTQAYLDSFENDELDKAHKGLL
ncbi:site-specific integrase [Rapidithrix thailandica]|uniref:Site-specific integrase n=1 Tax=Rapidithrix thailandica TaxID=413964 RepID=A0AAW9S8I3_9BACT